MIGGGLVLFGITLTGIYVSCRAFDYNITILRKVTAAGAFAVLNIIPIPLPFVDLLVPALALYMILIDNFYERSKVNRVFLLTFVFAIVSILLIYVPQKVQL
jgi:hypothetical protein